ncbi:hypothetical protein C1J05_01515 [Sulfitobacter sp. JL08]|nr:hypothetical protein C1J05_01515 [Sulfitobacter sp. JL08]
MVIIDLSANETKARAYSQQGHGKQHKPIQRPDTYQRLPEDMQLNTCEQQPVHTFGLGADLRLFLSDDGYAFEPYAEALFPDLVRLGFSDFAGYRSLTSLTVECHSELTR